MIKKTNDFLHKVFRRSSQFLLHNSINFELKNLKSLNPYKPAITITVLLLSWWLLTIWVNPLFLPRLDSLFKAFVELTLKSDIYINIFTTVYRALAGLFLSVIISVPLGLVFGRFPRIYVFFELPVDFFRSIPSSALFFLFIFIFGIGDASKIAIVVYGCSLILMVNTIYGARPNREKQDRINMLRSFGANAWQIFYLAVIRDAIPNIAAGFRVCISLSLVLVIVSEMFLAGDNGLGRQIYDFYLSYQIPEMYVVIIILGLLGFLGNKTSLLIEKRLSFWLND
jgi:ABC-type nitrate/sulfonate/bicarbonate transport system permease component